MLHQKAVNLSYKIYQKMLDLIFNWKNKNFNRSRKRFGRVLNTQGIGFNFNNKQEVIIKTTEFSNRH